MADDDPTYWYGPRRWGRRHPTNWKGWALDAGLVLTLLALGPYVRAHGPEGVGVFFGVLAIYAVIGHWKGEPNE